VVSQGHWLWPVLRPVLLALLFFALVVAVFATFQRSLIYYPHRVERLTPSASGLPLDRVRTVVTTTADGLTLHGWHVLPDGQSASGSEQFDRLLRSADWVALFFSGNGGHRGYRGPEMEILTQRGVHVVLFDYRGYGDNEGSPSEQGLAEDARAAWRFLVTDHQVPPNRVLLYGESLGGAVAVRLAAEQSRLATPPAGLILRSTFSTLADVGSYHFPWLPVRWLLVERYPSVELIREVTCPILQVHGTRDSIALPGPIC